MTKQINMEWMQSLLSDDKKEIQQNQIYHKSIGYKMVNHLNVILSLNCYQVIQKKIISSLLLLDNIGI